jgi:hypothetical protein
MTTLLVTLLLVLTPLLLLGGVALGTDGGLGEGMAAGGLLTLAAALVLLGLKVLRRALRRR